MNDDDAIKKLVSEARISGIYYALEIAHKVLPNEFFELLYDNIEIKKE